MRDSPSPTNKYYDYARTAVSHISDLVQPVVQGCLLDSFDLVPDYCFYRCVDDPHSHCNHPLPVSSVPETGCMELETGNVLLPFPSSTPHDTIAEYQHSRNRRETKKPYLSLRPAWHKGYVSGLFPRVVFWTLQSLKAIHG